MTVEKLLREPVIIIINVKDLRVSFNPLRLNIINTNSP